MIKFFIRCHAACMPEPGSDESVAFPRSSVDCDGRPPAVRRCPAAISAATASSQRVRSPRLDARARALRLRPAAAVCTATVTTRISCLLMLSVYCSYLLLYMYHN
jgi:hypothetical protein